MLCDDCGANLICPYCTAASQPRTIQPPSTSLRRFFAVVLEMYSFLMLQAVLPNRPYLMV